MELLGGAKIKYSTISDNDARTGGGIVSRNGLHMDSTTIADNHASNFDGGLSAEGNITIIASTISGNSASGVGGASLGSSDATQPVTIHQSTISGNTASYSFAGAGLLLEHDAIIKNSTITGNIARNPQNERRGAGISVFGSANVDLSSTIVADNEFVTTGNVHLADDIGMAYGTPGGTISGDHILLEYSSLATPAGTLFADPELGPLGNHGGVTWTHVPLATSPAINAGVSGIYGFDQRKGNYARVRGGQADIGAVERILDRIFFDSFEQ